MANEDGTMINTKDFAEYAECEESSIEIHMIAFDNYFEVVYFYEDGEASEKYEYEELETMDERITAAKNRIIREIGRLNEYQRIMKFQQSYGR